jgi:uncharacterized protein YprB with RNaseH-like and TPR domain
MRDLTSRLRDIVRQDHGGAAAPRRELTYVPDLPGASDLDAAAAALGGEIDRGSRRGLVTIDHVRDGGHWHGRRRVESYQLEPDAPLVLFDRRLAGHDGWARRVVFFDVETTGLSGGAGTVAFLAGCGWFEDEAFRVRQFFLAGPAGERAMLEALTEVFDEASLLVTYNGRSFDVPLMETRWAFHRSSAATDELAHFDMLPGARRLWGPPERRTSVSLFAPRLAGAAGEGGPDDSRSCSLSALERSVLGFHRLNDVPGIEIPARYFHFIRTGNAAAIEGVLEHNRYDLLSLAAVTSHACWLAREGPEACRDAGEQAGLGRLYEQAGESARAMRAYEMAAAHGDRVVKRHALARLAVLLRRASRHHDAAAAWQEVLDLSDRRAELSPIARRAAEALAIHHEHRARDLRKARQYAEALRTAASGRKREQILHRLGRLERKLKLSDRLNWD